MNKTDKEAFNKAIQGYVKDPKKYSESYAVRKDFAGMLMLHRM